MARSTRQAHYPGIRLPWPQVSLHSILFHNLDFLRSSRIKQKNWWLVCRKRLMQQIYPLPPMSWGGCLVYFSAGRNKYQTLTRSWLAIRNALTNFFTACWIRGYTLLLPLLRPGLFQVHIQNRTL